jgi:hypothetical protein
MFSKTFRRYARAAGVTKRKRVTPAHAAPRLGLRAAARYESGRTRERLDRRD